MVLFELELKSDFFPQTCSQEHRGFYQVNGVRSASAGGGVRPRRGQNSENSVFSLEVSQKLVFRGARGRESFFFSFSPSVGSRFCKSCFKKLARSSF